MASPEAALVRAAYLYGRALAGLDPVEVTIVLTDRRRRSVDVPPALPADPPPAPGARLLSPEGERIVDAVRAHGPLTAKGVIERSGVERTRCYVLLDDLAQRGVIRQGDDGYEAAG